MGDKKKNRTARKGERVGGKEKLMLTRRLLITKLGGQCQEEIGALRDRRGKER